MKTPDFTLEALGAILIGLVTNLIVLFGLDISNEFKAAITGTVNGAIGLAWLVGMAWVRVGRSKAIASGNVVKTNDGLQPK